MVKPKIDTEPKEYSFLSFTAEDLTRIEIPLGNDGEYASLTDEQAERFMKEKHNTIENVLLDFLFEGAHPVAVRLNLPGLPEREGIILTIIRDWLEKEAAETEMARADDIYERVREGCPTLVRGKT